MDNINVQYVTNENLKNISTAFNSNKELPSILLPKFFNQPFYKKILKQIHALHYVRIKHPILCSYSMANVPSSLSSLFNSQQFYDFLHAITNKKIKRIDMELMRFGWKDYTILNDKKIEKKGYDLFFDCTHEWNDSFGGSLVYVDGTGEYTKIASSGNSLIIIERKKNVQKFIQYVNHYAHYTYKYLFNGPIVFYT